jgi:hypothetical protein
VANNNRAVQPDLQRFLAKRMGVQSPTLSTAATSRCCRTLSWSSTLSVLLQKPFEDHPLQREIRIGNFRREPKNETAVAGL